MRKKILMFVMASSLVVGMTSCEKEEMEDAAITQTINVRLSPNESYTFVLPKNLRNDPYEITAQGAHYSVSQVGINAAGDRIFSYTPATDYSGTDVVVLSNDQEKEEHASHPAGPPPAGSQGNCNKGEKEDHYVITFNFVVEKNEAVTNK